MIKVNIHKKHSTKNEDRFQLDIDTCLPTDGVNVIMGRSGSGKSTFLRCLAGLDRPTGYISVNDLVWQDNGTFVPAHKRPIGFVFQDSYLLPHLSVLGNLKYAMKRCSPSEREKISLDHALSVLGIEELLERRPSELSGGEKQRVAIARALMVQPRILLMDEPLSSLDVQKKNEIIPYLSSLRAEFNLPIIYVTHSMTEVVKLADYVLMLDEGKIAGTGSVTEVFSNLDFTSYLGDQSGVVIKAKVSETHPDWGLAAINYQGEKLWVQGKHLKPNDDIRLRILAKDISITLSHSDDSSILNIIPANVEEIVESFNDSTTLLRLKVGSEYFVSFITRRSLNKLGLTSGMKVWAQIKSVAILD